jgi:hypothetical protein
MKRADRIRLGARSKIRPSTVKRNRQTPKGRSKSFSPTHWMSKMKDIPCFILGNAPSLNNIEDMSILEFSINMILRYLCGRI